MSHAMASFIGVGDGHPRLERFKLDAADHQNRVFAVHRTHRVA